MDDPYRNFDEYGFRYLPTHLIRSDNEKARNILTSFDYIISRLKILGGNEDVYGISDDWRQLKEFVNLTKESSVWEEFWRTKEHLLLDSDHFWPAHKIFLQLAWEHADDSPVTAAAEAWINQDKCDWSWVRLKPGHRKKKYRKSAFERVIRGHSDGVNRISIPINKDNLALTGSYDGDLRLWDIQSGKCLKVFTGTGARIRTCSIDGSGRRIVSTGYDDSLCLYDAKTGECLKTIYDKRLPITAAAASPSGDLVITGERKGVVKLWDSDMTICLRVFKEHRTIMRTIGWFPDNRRFFSVPGTSEKNIRIWEITSLKCIHKIEFDRDLRDYPCVSPSGNFFACGSERVITIWDMKTGNCHRILGGNGKSGEGHIETVSGLAFTPDEQQIISVSNDATIKVWDIDSGKCLKTIEGHVDEIYDVALALDGSKILTCSPRKTDRSIRIWDFDAQGLSERPAGHFGTIYAAAISNDRSLAATGSGQPDEDVRVWNLRTGSCGSHLKDCGGAVTGLAFSPDNKYIACGSRKGDLCLFHISTARLLRKWQAHANRILAISFSLDGQKLLSGGFDETVTVWSLTSYQPICVIDGLTDWVYSLSWSLDGRLSAAGLADGGIYILEPGIPDKPRFLGTHNDAIVSIVFQPYSNFLLSMSRDAEIKLWNMEKGACFKSYPADQFAQTRPEWFSLLYPTCANGETYSWCNRSDLNLNTDNGIRWCGESIEQSFMSAGPTVIERIGGVATMRILESVHASGTSQTGSPDDSPPSLPKYPRIEQKGRDTDLLLLQSCILLGWIFENLRKENARFFNSVQQALRMTNECRKDTVRHIRAESKKEGWAKRQNDLIGRSVDRIKKGIQNGMIRPREPFGGRVEKLMRKAENYLLHNGIDSHAE